jgi:hypothetical protein
VHDLECVGAAGTGSPDRVEHARQVLGVHATLEQLEHALEASRRQPKQLGRLWRPAQMVGAKGPRPDADAGRRQRHRELLMLNTASCCTLSWPVIPPASLLRMTGCGETPHHQLSSETAGLREKPTFTLESEPT